MGIKFPKERVIRLVLRSFLVLHLAWMRGILKDLYFSEKTVYEYE